MKIMLSFLQTCSPARRARRLEYFEVHRFEHSKFLRSMLSLFTARGVVVAIFSYHLKHLLLSELHCEYFVVVF